MPWMPKRDKGPTLSSRTGLDQGLSKVKLPKTKKANEIITKTAQRSNQVLGMQQAGELTTKTANGIRNIIRSNGAQQLARETSKNSDLLSTGIGKLSDGIVNQVWSE